MQFLSGKPKLDTYWRAVILFGRNVASYKFALAQSLIELSGKGQSFIPLSQLAEPFSRHIIEHLRQAPKQTTSSSSRFLEACRKSNAAEISTDELIQTTARLGFNNVIDAFHVINGADIPTRFFVDERKGANPGVRLTDEIFRLKDDVQFKNLPHEVEARWRLVETAWELGLPRGMVIGVEDDGCTLNAPRSGRRVPLAPSRDALNGYQKGKCFYCFSAISVDSRSGDTADVDHFFLRVLLLSGVKLPIGGVWNLVLACRDCNRGTQGKSARIASMRLLERLSTRNEFLIQSHHPLRETLIAQTGENSRSRMAFLNDVYRAALPFLNSTWEPKAEHESAF